jgi:hypothetical protein
MEIGGLRSITFLSHYQWLWPSHKLNTHEFNVQLFFMDCYHQELCVISGFHCGVNEIFALGAFPPTPAINSLHLKTGSSVLTFTGLKESFYIRIVHLWSSWGHIFTYMSPYHNAGFVFWNILLLCMPLSWLLCFFFFFFFTLNFGVMSYFLI